MLEDIFTAVEVMQLDEPNKRYSASFTFTRAFAVLQVPALSAKDCIKFRCFAQTEMQNQQQYFPHVGAAQPLLLAEADVVA